MSNYDELKTYILDEVNFIRATFSGMQRGQEHPWKKLVIRPVMLKNRRHLQFSWYDQKQNFVENYTGNELVSQLDEALAVPFTNITVQTTTEAIQVQITKKGKALIHHHKTQVTAEPNLAHDRDKQTILSPHQPESYLQAIGIQTEDGKIRATMQSKFTQINEFLRLLDETGEFEQQDRAWRVLDCGCGNAYLTFAAYHYLTQIRGIACHMTGIDTNAKLLENHAAKLQALGWDHLDFVVTRIEAYVPETPPDMVLALHACDTATDDAIAQGIRWNSRVIVAVPCCHHDLQAQLAKTATPAPFGELMGYGLMHQRMGDLLTDNFRALLLRLCGYKVDIVEFVGTEHTPKNLMLRAVKTGQPDDPHVRAEYESLKAMWQVTPYLEKLI